MLPFKLNSPNVFGRRARIHHQQLPVPLQCQVTFIFESFFCIRCYPNFARVNNCLRCLFIIIWCSYIWMNTLHICIHINLNTYVKYCNMGLWITSHYTINAFFQNCVLGYCSSRFCFPARNSWIEKASADVNSLVKRTISYFECRAENKLKIIYFIPKIKVSSAASAKNVKDETIYIIWKKELTFLTTTKSANEEK